MLPKDPYNIRLSGRGGQGILLAGVILAEAAMKDGMEVVQTQSYGPQARLGASKGELVLSHHTISYPEVEEPDLLLCLSIDSYVKYGNKLAPGGLKIVEERVTLEEKVNNALILPILQTALSLGNIISANMVALGTLVELTQLVSRNSIEIAMKERIKPNYLELNINALKAGFELGALHSKHVN